jgi:hypothetical protein
MPERDEDLEARLKVAYATAIHLRHQPGRVEIHVGQEVIDYLKSFLTHVATSPAGANLWGFPLVVAEEADAWRLYRGRAHISVHAIQTIA